MNSHVSLNSQTLKAKELFLAINYNPKLGPFADTWDDLVDEFGSKLHFEKISYQNHYESRFQEPCLLSPVACRHQAAAHITMSRCRHRRSHRAATTALPPSRCAPPPQRRHQAAANVTLSCCRHRLAAAMLPPTSDFALPPPPQLPRCCRHAATTAALSPSCRQPRAVALLPPPHCRLLVCCCVVVHRPISSLHAVEQEDLPLANVQLQPPSLSSSTADIVFAVVFVSRYRSRRCHRCRRCRCRCRCRAIVVVVVAVPRRHHHRRHRHSLSLCCPSSRRPSPSSLSLLSSPVAGRHQAAADFTMSRCRHRPSHCAAATALPPRCHRRAVCRHHSAAAELPPMSRSRAAATALPHEVRLLLV